MVRAIAVLTGSLLLAAMVMRGAWVDAFAGRDPARAALLWSSHPSVTLTSGLAEVGAAAAANQPVSPVTVRRMLAASAKAPLAPEPFLVRGVEASVAGNPRLAERAFLEAQRRDPRSIAARYFLADQYLRSNDTSRGLAQIAALTRLVPQSLDAIAPYLAAFARGPDGVRPVKALLADQPLLEPLLLNQLAAAPNDIPLAFKLWNGRTDERDRAWQERLVDTLIGAGRYREARSAWARFNSGMSRGDQLTDPRFEGQASPPFGWKLVSGPAGVAEPDGGGRLHILYYGRDDLVLASQLLMLPAGSYRLSMRVGTPPPSAGSLAWTLRCLPARQNFMSAGLATARGGVLTASFSIPAAGCEAQQLQLAGTAPDVPEQADLTISDLAIARSKP